MARSRTLPHMQMTLWIVAAIFILLSQLTTIGDWLDDLDRDIHDRLIASAAPESLPDDLIFLGIDEASLSVDDTLGADVISRSPALQAMQKRFPWDRNVYAAAIDRLIAAGADTVVIDLLFTEPAAGDAALQAALERHGANVVLAGAFAPVGGSGETYTYSTTSDTVLPMAEVREGFVNFWPTPEDGLLRTARLDTTLGEVSQGGRLAGEPLFHSLASVATQRTEKALPIRFAAPVGSLTSDDSFISFHEIFSSSIDFTGKTVLIGAASPRFQDQHATPTGIHYGGVLHLSVMHALRSGQHFQLIESRWLTGTVLLAMIVLLSLLRSRATWKLIALATLSTAAVVIAILLAHQTLQLLPISAILIGASILTAVSIAIQAWADYVARVRLQDTFGRHVSAEMAHRLSHEPLAFDRLAEPRECDVIVLFADVRGFSTKVTELSPASLRELTNDYLTRMTRVIFDHGGTIDKFIGDGIMATWGAFDEEGADTPERLQVLKCARAMVATAGQIKVDRRGMRIGVGIAAGTVTAGEFGSDARSQLTVLGPAVNLAARLESLTKSLQQPILCDDSFASLEATTPLGEHDIAGMGPHRVHAVEEAFLNAT